MGKTLTEIAEEIKVAANTINARPERSVDVKAQLIYAHNGTGKTRLSREFKELISPKDANSKERDDLNPKILYYNAFTEDLFFWNNGLDKKMIIQPNGFTDWIFKDEGQQNNIATNFQHYTKDKLTPFYNAEYTEVKFSFERGNEEEQEYVKISKGEESCYIWSVFYTLFRLVIDILNEPEDKRETDRFNNLSYIFIDDPVSSLDDNHLIELAVDITELIKSSKSQLKFIITTHNPLFYNVLHNGLKNKYSKKYLLENFADGTFSLIPQSSDSPFSYHLFLFSELEKAIASKDIKRYHFNFLRNILEKTSTFLGYTEWNELLPENDKKDYYTRIINLYSHYKHHGEEVSIVTEKEKEALIEVMGILNTIYHFKKI